MSVKDDSEVNMMKRAASITLEIYSKVFKENIKDIIDADKVRESLAFAPNLTDLFEPWNE